MNTKEKQAKGEISGQSMQAFIFIGSAQGVSRLIALMSYTNVKVGNLKGHW